jgi:hypothetical protein
MREATEVLQGTRDADGVLHIGDPNAGCWSCGATELKYSANGKVAVHHPGTECCAPAINRLIEMMKTERTRHRKDAADFNAAIAAERARAENSIGNEAAKARARADSMQRAFDSKLRDYWLPITDGTEGEPGLSQEIERLSRKAAWLKSQETVA